MKLIYLACPYSHENPEVMEARLKYVTQTAGHLMKCGLIVFSPITHGALIAKHENMPHTWDFWAAQDLEILCRCDALYVLAIPGWSKSIGVKAEIEMAKKRGMEVKYVLPEALPSHINTPEAQMCLDR